jgi:drug/metabolite transporter (DMT)-like permease
MMKEKVFLKPGVAAAFMAASLFGISTPLAKSLLGDISPLFLAGLLYLGSGLGLTAIYVFNHLALRKKTDLNSTEAGLERNDFFWLAGAVLCGGVLGPIMLTSGLSLTTGSAASLLLNMEGILTAFVAAFVFREAVDKRIWIAALMMLFGSLALSYKPNEMVLAFSPGAILVTGACLMWAFDNNLTRNLSGKDPFTIARSKGLAAGITTLVIAWCAGEKFPLITPVIGSLCVGMFGYGVSLVLFVYALRHLGSARTGAYFGIGPFVGALVSVILLKDPITWLLLMAAFFMALGAWILLKEEHIHEHVHEYTWHEHRHTHEDGHHWHEHAEGIREDTDHSHLHEHKPLAHEHAHTPELHHRHPH